MKANEANELLSAMRVLDDLIVENFTEHKHKGKDKVYQALDDVWDIINELDYEVENHE